MKKRDRYQCTICSKKYKTIDKAIKHNEEDHGGFARFTLIFYDITRTRKLPLTSGRIPTSDEDRAISQLAVQQGITYHQAKASFFGDAA